MKLAFNIAFGIHIVAVLGLLGALLSQLSKNPKKLITGIMHSAWTALGAGFVMLALNPSIHKADASVDLLNPIKFSVKAAILATIIYIGLNYRKKDELPSKAWASMLVLTVVNIVIATSWN